MCVTHLLSIMGRIQQSPQDQTLIAKRVGDVHVTWETFIFITFLLVATFLIPSQKAMA